MSARTHPSEKVMAVVGVYKALVTELGWTGPFDPIIASALIHTATTIAMATDTRDMGIMAPPQNGLALTITPDVCDDCGMPSGAHDYEVEH